MRILVVGDGKVGHTLAEHLAREGHDVVIVDRSEEVLQRSEDTLDVLCVRGNGANAATLVDAGADKADIIIAATASDETNMLCCLVAKKLGTKYSIARIRDPEYNDSLTLLQREMGIDMPVNPERATALEISRLLRFPFASNIESFAKGRVEMVEFRAQEHDVVVGHALKDLPRKLNGLPQVLYAAVEREGNVVIPNGDFIIRAGDRVHVAADMVTITSYFRYLGKNSLRVKNVMLLGGGRISYYLAKMIVPMGIHVSMIEINEKKANDLSESLPDVNVIYGDGTDQELLEQEGLQQMDAFVALCDRDEENLMTGTFCRQGRRAQGDCEEQPRGLCRYHQRHGSGQHYHAPRPSPAPTFCATCAAGATPTAPSWNASTASVNGKAEALEFIPKGTDPYIGIPLRKLNIRRGTLVAVIVRQGKVIVPFGNDHIEAGDRVVVIACESGISDLNEVIRK